ncbi:polysaccharide pyruvyl transferase CsaB [Lysinibacillus sp. 2017]|uniref:polysaccharide pyruvyl transferase CsaB n=1 Tax=unclassified Lysinibacillus TaxID=2636778 RepID=UPI000D526BFF|nr:MULTISPECIES: polysaccharide pyruvyl transferase CsaB [unclassified Lysinibacillus]AWE06325.1 polysaccharide pyruvyl transferase CsaB [Lysinibacillus sp. 2017]TGN34997.1 polysaccharide pyruvyl transferase CsaB [Lysinibacillus sp. S2017]
MHIVLSGYYGFDNVGDEAILLSIITALRKQQPAVELTVLSNNPEKTAKTYDVKAIDRWQLKEIARALKKADGLISGGGSLLQDQTGMKTIPYYCIIMRMAKFVHTPVFVYAQGMGPINHPMSRFITKGTLNKVAHITLRDEASKQLLEQIGVKKQMSIVPDPVIGLDASSFRSDWLTRQAFEGSYITVSVRDWPSEVNFKQKIVDSLDLLAAEGHQIVFIPMHDEHDEKTSFELVHMMKEKSVVAPGNLSIEEKVTIIGQSDLLIGMRLHSLIFSAIQATPFIALSYDPKIDAFAAIANQPNMGHVEKDDWNGVQLFEKAVDMLRDHAIIEQALRVQVAQLQVEAQNTALLALETFKGQKR